MIRPAVLAFSLVTAVMIPAALSFLAATSVPTDIQMPGTQPQEVSQLQSVDRCNNCHGGYDLAVEPFFTWQSSMMSHATRDPLFWATVAIAEQDFPGAGDLCLRCHTPEGWIGGRSVPTDGSALAAGDMDGVSCDLCHRLTNPDFSEHQGTMSPPFLANDEDPIDPEGYYGSGMYAVWNGNSKLGPYDDTVARHDFLGSDFHRDACACGTCHDVSNPAVGDLAHNNGAQVPLAPGTFSGVPGSPVDQKAAFNNFPYQYGVVERTFSEHQASAYSDLPISEYVNLPPELQAGSLREAYLAATAVRPDGNYADGDPRTFSCQSCHMPPVTGKGCDKADAPLRPDLPLHRMVGGNYWVPQAIQYQDARGQLVVGGGLTATQIAALDAGAAAARALLEQAASLQVDGNELTITNLTGHKLISGYPEGRRMWLRTRWYDASENLLREDGAYGPLAVTIDGQPADVDTILDLDDPNTRIYEAHFAITQEWANQLLGLGWPADLPLIHDRVTGQVARTLGDVAAQAPGTSGESFHFVLNNTLVADNRIPPYGFAVDEARARNTLPVPEDQYGHPAPGGVYDHQDVFTLSPPSQAARAELELLYQPTSWEYIQFLYLANTGAEPFLAATGRDLLEAWRNTGMAAPHVMASATWTGTPDPWFDLGHGLAGSFGVPSLEGTGTLQPGTPARIELDNARPNAASGLFIGFSQLFAPFKGGTLVPNPDLILLLPTDGNGEFAVTATWPNLPSDASLTFQFWITDPAGPAGYAASNALEGVTP